jgi:hypothetical protein
VSLVVEAHGIVKVAEGGFRAFGMLPAPMHEEAHAQAAEHAQQVNGIAVAHAAFVFLRGHIQALVEAVLDAPTLTIELQPAGGLEALWRCTAEQVDSFRLAGADLPMQDGGLSCGREADLLRVDALALEGANFLPAFILLLGLRPSGGGGGRDPARGRAG